MSRADSSYISTRTQRYVRREMIALLESDLYKRAYRDSRARWESPLGWVVEYGPNDDGLTLWGRIIDPSGNLFAEVEDATVDWLDGVLP